MSHFENFILKLYVCLTGNGDSNSNIIRKHSRKLEQLGDISFPLDIKNWHHLIEATERTSILEYSADLSGRETCLKTLSDISEPWLYNIEKCIDIKNNCHVFLKRFNIFKITIEEVLNKSDTYGAFHLNLNISLKIDDFKDDRTQQNLTDLRKILLRDVTNNFLQFVYCDVKDGIGSKYILITSKSNKNDKDVIICGPVLNAKGTKDVVTTSDDFYKQRIEDMQLMAEHKYGIRIRSKLGWQEMFHKFGAAAVVIEMLQNKSSHTATIDMNNHYAKNASFILYNCARLYNIFKEFDKKVESNIYPPLPPLDSIDFTLLKQPEEWELLYVYILQFPLTIKNCINDIAHCKINVHYLVTTLSAMASLISVYYRRIRILTDPRTHLFPILHARIYLLKATEQVFHNSLHLLGIEPVKQM